MDEIYQATEGIPLSFAEYQAGHVVCYWSPERTGAWGSDCKTGREAAVELATAMKETENVGLLKLVLASMFIHGRPDDAIEVSFMSTIAELMKRGLRA